MFFLYRPPNRMLLGGVDVIININHDLSVGYSEHTVSAKVLSRSSKFTRESILRPSLSIMGELMGDH